ncbi:MAG: response regulator transcription factor [Verrucomicrobiota bacterium]
MKTKVKPAPIRVALVEDDTALRELFKGWIQSAPNLELAGEFADAEYAMDQLPNQPPDVVLMDINLPGSNGIECVRVLKPQMASTQFMMVTVYSDANLIFEALGAGATGYLLKRSTRDELLAAIAEIARGGSPMSSTIARMIAQSFHRPAPAAPAMDHLAPQEQRVLELMAQGFAHKEIAAELAIGIPTVGTYIRRIYDKLHVYTRAQAIAKFHGR